MNDSAEQPLEGHKRTKVRMPRGMRTEKAKDTRASIKKLLGVLAPDRIALGVVVFLTLASTLFNVIGPKVLSLATTEVFNGSVAARPPG